MGRNRFLGQKSIGAIFFSETTTVADVVDAEVVVIGDKTYEYDVAGDGVVAGNILVLATGSPDSDTLADTLVAAINANKPTVPVTAKKNPAALDTAITSGVRIEADNPGAAGNIAFTTTMATGTSKISGSGLLEGGENPGTQTYHRGKVKVSQADIDLGGLVIPTSLQTVKADQFEVQVRSSTGLFKAITDLVSIIDSNKIQVNADGATTILVNDVVVWNAWE